MSRNSTPQTKFLFLTKYVCHSRTNFLGPVGERYAGLYFTFMERFRSRYDFFWYTGDDGGSYRYDSGSNTLKPLSEGTTGSWFSLVRFMMWFCFSNLGSRKICVVSYPYFPFPRCVLLAILLFVLKPFRMTVLVDVQDLARETPGTTGARLWNLIDGLYDRCASYILNADECAKLYRARTSRPSIVIPMAAHHDLVTPRDCKDGVSPPTSGKMVLGYIGTISKMRGFPELIHVVEALRKEGLDLELVINGNNTENIDLGNHDWIRIYERQPFEALCELLRTFDVGLIPYLDSGYWNLMSITKMATYMSAGLTNLILRLTETSNILDRWDCGVSADDWKEFSAAIRDLYRDPALRQRLAENARKAALEEYNWVKQADRLGEFVESLR